MLRVIGSCNQCGQCCGGGGAPNPSPPFPSTWPESVRNWQIAVLAESAPIFQVTGHPDLGGARAGAVRIGNKTFRWIWIPGRGLCADQPPWGDESAYLPQCPVLMPEQQGVWACGIAGTPWQVIRDRLGCRDWPEWEHPEYGLGKWITEEGWTQWMTDHPACSYTVVPA